MSHAPQPSDEPPSRPAPRRRAWRAKFQDAFRGLKLGVRGHSSFFVHFFVAAVVLAAAATFNVDWIGWCILIGCIAAVIAAELFNSAIEVLARVLHLEQHEGGKAPLDIAAGAVLAVSLGAALIGAIVFAVRLWEMAR
jgi:diacylglycerol kinase